MSGDGVLDTQFTCQPPAPRHLRPQTFVVEVIETLNVNITQDLRCSRHLFIPVMRTTLSNLNLSIFNSIYKAVVSVNSPAPKVFKIMF